MAVAIYSLGWIPYSNDLCKNTENHQGLYQKFRSCNVAALFLQTVAHEYAFVVG